MTTLATVRALCTQTMSLTEGDADVVDAFINEAVRDFARDAQTNPIEYVFDTVVGQRVYDLSDVAPIGVLRFLPDNESFVEDTEEYHFTVRGLAWLEIDATPTEITTLRGWIVPRPEDLIVDADPLPFPTEYDKAIRYRACQLIGEWDRQDPNDVAMWETKYENEVRKAHVARRRAGRNYALRPSARFGGTSSYGDGLTL